MIFLFFIIIIFFFLGGGGQTIWGGEGVQEDDIAMKVAQSKLIWGGNGVNGGGGGAWPRSYATGSVAS